MASGANGGSGDVFDVRRVRKLVELMDEHDLAEIVLQQGEQKMKLRRGPDPTAVTGVPMQGYAPVAAAAPGPAAAAPAGPAPAAEPAASGPVIKSPMVGTFYSSSNPESPPFVKVGDQVGPESIVCIVEAMKVFNEIPAECSGKITAVLVEDGASVEFGQPIFQLEG
ncbi:Acetyl-CoA biotin carboxyl carrier [Posidoniimonas polymericola]|uniref:Biotin carboxyl carrier protein of acetyl-CoA carboxylase n=1 Tax=Posidoniimonas polymericola TaxID=2528002 RepID=A0A5C5XW95_9BACT|nr:acetyl-CoA carboxylase biotin carboxyl carrier protein [Posidoniimonas polymericola]TWT66801.1 Acetyl-CoA biotin carboxyl carrier [Posidoniimonas polymericola]